MHHSGQECSYWHLSFYSPLWIYLLIVCVCVYLCLSQHVHAIDTCLEVRGELSGVSFSFRHVDAEDQAQVCRPGSTCLHQLSHLASLMLWHIIWVINIVIITTYNTPCGFPCSQIRCKLISQSGYWKNFPGIFEDLVFFLKPWVSTVGGFCTLLFLVHKQWKNLGRKGQWSNLEGAGWHKASMSAVRRCLWAEMSLSRDGEHVRTPAMFNKPLCPDI